MYNLQLSIAVAAQDGGSQGIAVTNRLYISSVHQTVAGCTIYGWLPLWLQTFRSGPIWFYETGTFLSSAAYRFTL
jgi:hypothetical protein